MTKSRDNPMLGASRRSSRAHSAWKVEIHIARQLVSRSDSTRERISSAALLVKVTASTPSARRVLLRNEIGDAMRDDARLPRTGASENQQRSTRVLDRGTLFGVEGGEKVHEEGTRDQGQGWGSTTQCCASDP